MTMENFQCTDGLKVGNLPQTRSSRVEMILRVAEVGIHEAGEEQSGTQGFRKRVTGSSGWNVWQVESVRR